jgi:hypothetical protein
MQIAGCSGQGSSSMTNSQTEKRARQTKARTFYIIGLEHSIRTTPGLLVENLEALAPGVRVLHAPVGKRGFPHYPEPPRLLIDKSLGRAPLDCEIYHAYWLVSDRMKALLEDTDPEGVVFTRCETRLRDGSEGPIYWLCDVVRILDAIDEEKSRVRIRFNPRYNSRTYDLVGGASLLFKQDVVGQAHIFRLRYSQSNIVCDQTFRDAYKNAGLRGLSFKDASKY